MKLFFCQNLKVLTTSRSSILWKKRFKELDKYGVKNDQLLMDLPHCQN